MAQLIHDSGLDLYRADTQTTNTQERLTHALQGAHARHLATPDAERVYTVQEAIRCMAQYVVYAIGTGGRAQVSQPDLPDLIAPFAPLSKALTAILYNAIATCSLYCEARLDFAHDRWRASLDILDTLTPSDMEHVEAIRNAVAYVIGTMEVQLGLPSAIIRRTTASNFDPEARPRDEALQATSTLTIVAGSTVRASRSMLEHIA